MIFIWLKLTPNGIKTKLLLPTRVKPDGMDLLMGKLFLPLGCGCWGMMTSPPFRLKLKFNTIINLNYDKHFLISKFNQMNFI